MALGDVYNNNNKKKDYSPTVYSPYSLSNPESQVDPTKLSFNYWNNMLKIIITPRKTNTGDDTVAFDYDNSISVYLTHTKARLLAQEIELFKADPSAYANVGVPSGSGLITLSNGKEFSVNCPCLVIRKIDEQGNVNASIAYQFKQQYHYTIRNYNEKTNDFDKVYYDTLELDELLSVLRNYYEAMTGATAYSMIEQSKYDMSRINTKLELVGDKLGIEFGKNGNKGGGKSSSSFFNSKEGSNNSSGGFSNSSIEDIDALMG